MIQKIKLSSYLLAIDIFHKVENIIFDTHHYTRRILFYCCLCISIKYFEDIPLPNKFFCKRLCCNMIFFNNLENNILHLVQYKLYRSNNQFFNMYMKYRLSTFLN